MKFQWFSFHLFYFSSKVLTYININSIFEPLLCFKSVWSFQVFSSNWMWSTFVCSAKQKKSMVGKLVIHEEFKIISCYYFSFVNFVCQYKQTKDNCYNFKIKIQSGFCRNLTLTRRNKVRRPSSECKIEEKISSDIFFSWRWEHLNQHTSIMRFWSIVNPEIWPPAIIIILYSFKKFNFWFVLLHLKNSENTKLKWLL